MKKPYTILIADRNSHVREFIKRELASEGFMVKMAENGQEVLKWVYHFDDLDLVILDPDFPDADRSELLKKLADRIPSLPVVIHTFIFDEDEDGSHIKTAVYVEKGGRSIERLKRAVVDLLDEKQHPG